MVAALAVLCAPAAAGADTSTDVRTLIERAAYQWAAAQQPDATFPNPVAAEVARGYRGFGPPMLLYGLYRTGQRYGNPQLERQADRGWRVAVAPEQAGAFDMLAAAYTLRHVQLPASTRAFLQDYIRRYVGYRPGACVAAAQVLREPQARPRRRGARDDRHRRRLDRAGHAARPTRPPPAAPRRSSSTARCRP